MIGQLKNVSYLSSLRELPRFIVVLGPKGSGRRTMLREEFSRRGAEMAQIDGKVDSLREAIALANQRAMPTAFAVDASDFSANSAGTLLKVAEETPAGTWFALIAESRSLVYPTLLSRALVLEMAPYSREEFEQYSGTLSEYGVTAEEASALSSYCQTFGDLFSLVSLKDHGASLLAFADLVLNNIASAPLHNALMIPSHLALRDKSEGHRPDLFLNVVSAKLSAYPSDPATIRMARATSEARSLLSNRGLNRQMVMDEWVFRMRGEPGWN